MTMSTMALIPPDRYKDGADFWVLLEKIDGNSSNDAQKVLAIGSAKLRRQNQQILSNINSTNLDNQLGGKTSEKHAEMLQIMQMKGIPTDRYLRIICSMGKTDIPMLQDRKKANNDNQVICVHFSPSNSGFVHYVKQWKEEFYALLLKAVQKEANIK